jgi:2-amino-4-hydroxy-6-hydroxymethyldihydropteridine diphosphokinase
LYNDEVFEQGKLKIPREEILFNAFVLRPLAELAPDLKHPVEKKTYAELWNAFDQDSQPLWPITTTT